MIDTGRSANCFLYDWLTSSAWRIEHLRTLKSLTQMSVFGWGRIDKPMGQLCVGLRTVY